MLEFVVDPNIKREIVEYADDDKEAIKQPSLLQSAMDMKQVDSDEELEEDEDSKGTPTAKVEDENSKKND